MFREHINENIFILLYLLENDYETIDILRNYGNYLVQLELIYINLLNWLRSNFASMHMKSAHDISIIFKWNRTPGCSDGWSYRDSYYVWLCQECFQDQLNKIVCLSCSHCIVSLLRLSLMYTSRRQLNSAWAREVAYRSL